MITPGKWTIERSVDENLHRLFTITNRHRNLAEVNTACGLALQEGEDNARLIAAAPETAKERDELKIINAELLAACKEIVSQIEGDAQYEALERHINEAIAKTETN